MADQSGRDAAHAVFGLGDERRPTEASQTPAGAGPQSGSGSPQVVYVQAPPSPPTPVGVKVLFALVAVLVILAGINLYWLNSTRHEFADLLSRQTDQTNLLTRRMDTSDEHYAQLKGQFDVTGEKLGLTQSELARARSLATQIQAQQKEAVAKLNNELSTKASTEDVSKVSTDANTKIGALSSDLAGTRKDLTDALTGTKGELSGAIARTHDELVELAHRSDRDYFEFSLGRKSARQKVGSVTLILRKTNPKKNQFTVGIVSDDQTTERKDKSINEPLYFLARGASSPLELVVNKLSKESISGYISTPKGFFAGVPNVLQGRPES
jgi:hypothetical protein